MAQPKFTSAEQEKTVILTAAIEGKITNNQAAKRLRLSVRQVQRAKARIRNEGSSAVVHRLKGKPSNHSYAQETKIKTLEIIEQQYPDFKPTFATEKLEENHAITVCRETTRLWMIEKGLWKPRKQKKTTHRSWRTRKEYFGELQQFDGSYHYWFENRFFDSHGDPIEVCLLASIDDATGRITKAVFAKNEGIHAVFTFWEEYCEAFGKPLGIYLDKFSTYKINHKSAVDNNDLMTQFQRVTNDLGITLIHAHSPQAKGRVERLFKTLQDRLIKEMRLAQISTPEEGNRFIKEVFLSKFNAKFSVIPAKDGDIHKQLCKEEIQNIHHIFSIHEERTVHKDFTIQFKNHWYQLTELQPTTVRPKNHVTIEVWLDESVHLMFKTKELNYLTLPEKPQKQSKKQPTILTTHKLNYKPSKNHPWRQYQQSKPLNEGDDISILE